MDLSKIKIENISQIITPILISKFLLYKIQNLEEVLEIVPDEFGKLNKIGKKVVEELIKFQKIIIENPEDIYNLYEKNTKIYELPVDFSVLQANSFIELLNEVIIDYLNFRKEMDKGIITHYYGLNKSDLFTLEDLGSIYNKTRERIRQRKEEILYDLRLFLQGKESETERIFCNSSVIERYEYLRRVVIDKRVLTIELLEDLLIDDFSYDKRFPETIKLLIDLFSLHVCGKVKTRFTNAEIIICNSEEGENFIKSAEILLKVLRKEIYPLNEMQLIVFCKKKNKKLINIDVLKAAEILPEVEIIVSNESIFYQAKFEFLSRASDRAFRVLLENGEPMYIDNIVSEINKRLFHSSTEKIYDRYSLALATDQRFISLGKTGNWSLKIWNSNSGKIDMLIKKALLSLDRPSSYNEIFEEISKERKGLKFKSVCALIGRDCLKVESDKWILPEWKQRYSELAFTTRKRRESNGEPEYKIEQRSKIFEYLQKKDAHSALASDIIKALKDYDKRFTKVSFYKIFGQEEFFKKSITGNKNIITLKKIESNVTLAIDKYNWLGIKEKLYRDLYSYFADELAPVYSFTLEEGISLFKSILDKPCPVSEFAGINDRILGNLNKYYFEASDRTDKLNFLKQFLTCLDPFCKKILFYIDNTSYNFITTNKKGLGEIFNKLSRIDPTKERNKVNSRLARSINFGKQIQTTYFYRNNDVHSANDWTELEVANAITSCLVVYIFVGNQYYSEIKLHID
ncbi:hypothetical protein [Flavobacterium piscis]|uniref:HTH HARE-type domain-containing protein n=2 Tax=Flavobacterium piscis TaxID=1114874 RepID=A0ABX2XNK6_9FLAO|nr:hypothetical protein [Flavobacterium piscis]OCB77583.1 hypothetical protein FLP_01300 [Flavobacterium piscis]